MSTWGRAAYGDPCRECDYPWPNDIDAMVSVVQQSRQRITEALVRSDGTARAPELAWDARSYVCHVVDNLRIWAERLVAALSDPGYLIGTYDADLLAVARGYAAVPVSAALWSLDDAVHTWQRAVQAARLGDVMLVHPDRGRLALADVVSTNTHDAHHHAHDVRRSVGGTTVR